MKKIFVILFLCLVWGGSAFGDQFCDGFEDGFNKGRRVTIGSSGFSPFCPFQPFKSFDDPSNDYDHGFNVGLKKGCDGDSNCYADNKK